MESTETVSSSNTFKTDYPWYYLTALAANLINDLNYVKGNDASSTLMLSGGKGDS